MTFTKIGKHTWGCIYDAMETVPSWIRRKLAGILCTIQQASLAADSALKVNWGQYCRGAAGMEGSTNANESWDGVYFIAGAIALDLHDIGLSGTGAPSL